MTRARLWQGVRKRKESREVKERKDRRVPGVQRAAPASQIARGTCP